MNDVQPLRADRPSVQLDRRLGRRAQRFRRDRAGGARIDLAARLAENPIFADLNRSTIDEILSRSIRREFPLGAVVLKQSRAAEGLFILREGQVRIVDESLDAPVTVAKIGAGAVFGERSLLLGDPISMTVRASGRVVVDMLGTGDFSRLMRERPEIRDKMFGAIQHYERINFLKTQRVFLEASTEDIEALLATVRIETIPMGAALAPDGETDDRIALVRHGRFAAEGMADPDPNAPEDQALPVMRRVGDLRHGDFAGLRRLFNPGARPISLTASEDSEIWRWRADDFRAVLDRRAGIASACALAAAQDAQRLDTLLGVAAYHAVDRPSAKQERRLWCEDARMGRRRLRLWRAGGPLDAGRACLGIAAEQLGLRAETILPRDDTGIGHAGESLFSLAEIAEGGGVVTRLLKLPAAEVSDLIAPAVTRGPEGSFVTILGRTRRGVTVADPISGCITQTPIQDVSGWWTGEALALAITPDYGATGQKGIAVAARVLPLLKPHHAAIVQIFLLTLIGLGIGLAAPFATQVIIDNVLVFGDRDLLNLLLIAILFTAVMGMVGDAVRSLLTLRIANLVNAVMMSSMFAHVLAAQLNTLTRWRTGELSARFEENGKIFALSTAILQVLVVDVLSVVIFTAVLFLLQPLLAAVVLSVSLMICAVMVWASPRFRANDRAMFDVRQRLMSHVIETFDGIETIKMASREDRAITKGVDLFQAATEVEISAYRLNFRLEIATSLLGTLATLSVFGLGATMVIDGQMTPGALIAFSGLVGAVMGPLAALAGVYDEVQELRIAVERVNDVLDLPRETGGGLSPCPPLTGRICFENVSFAYDADATKTVLSEINLDIPAGSSVAFVGPSGSGKSTLARLINRLLDCTEGRVLIDGLDVKQIEPGSLRRQIGMVEQSPYVFSGSIRENIAKARPGVSFDQIVTAARMSGAADFIEKFPMGYNTRVGEGGRSLSGGQAQRLVIARAIASDPRILVLDEATSALDTESETFVKRGLDAAMVGRTTIAVAHRLKTIMDADMIVVLDRGRIVETGTHDALIAKGAVYHKLWTAGTNPEKGPQDVTA